MNQEDIIRMAREAGWSEIGADLWGATNDGAMSIYALERFATLVAAAERKQYEHTLALQKASYEREIKIEVAAEREKVAHWMRNCGYATGHGDTMESLLGHLGTQIAEGLKVEVLMEREACADICDEHDDLRHANKADLCATEIRARGNK